MSAKATFWAWDQPGLSGPEKLVLLCLADCHNADNNRCDPSDRYISEQTGLDRKTVPRARRLLIKKAVIQCEPRPGKSPKTSFIFEPQPGLDLGFQKQPATPETGTPKNGVTPETGTSESGQPAPPNTGTHPPQKRVTNLKEPKKNLTSDAGNRGNPIPGEFQPSTEVMEALQVIHGVDPLFLNEQVIEFRIYWRESNAPRRSWDAAFLNRCCAQWRAYGGKWKAEWKQHLEAGQASTRSNTLADDLSDRSWAERTGTLEGS